MSRISDDIDVLTTQTLALLPVGRTQAIKASHLAEELGTSERMVRALVDELIEQGVLVGSVCSGPFPGYYICQNLDDLEAGCAHLVARARSMFARVRALRAAAEQRFGYQAARLFEIEEVAKR